MSLLIKHFYRFGDFTLDTDQRVLLRKDKPVALTPKVFDTLLILVENKGRIVEKEELMNRLWPDTFVEEANLTFNIKQLRKSLSDDARDPIYIETISRRGYRFIANVDEVLTEKGGVNDQVTTRFETSDAPPSVATGERVNEAKADQPTPAHHSAKARSSAVIQSNPDPSVAHQRSFSNPKKRKVAVAAALVIGLTGIGLAVWRFSNGSDGKPGEGNSVDDKGLRASQVRIEKLTGTGKTRLAAISPDGKYIAYTRDFEQKSSLWLRQLATNTNVEIVPASGIVYGLAFTKSGESLYFVKRDGETALYRVALLGGVATRIADQLEGNFSISSDDTQIVFVRKLTKPDGQREYSLITVRSDGTGERSLLAQPEPDRLDTPLWSPDDQTIICSSGNSDSGAQDVSIVEISVASGIKTELSHERFFHIAKMAWLPGQRGLIMSARRNLGEYNQLWRISYPGIEITQLTEGFSSYQDLSIASGTDKGVASQATRISDIWVGSSREPRNLKKITQATDHFCWTPAGQLVYWSTASSNGDIWIMEADGTRQKQLTVNTATNATPVVTSDNRSIIFISNRNGAFQVWRMNLDGSNQVQLTMGAPKNYPAVSPDGKWVLYNTTDDRHLWKVSIDGGEPIPVCRYVASHPSVSPDGKMIACTTLNESKLELQILPFEGGEPLKRIAYDGRNSRLQWTDDGKAIIYAGERNGERTLMRQSVHGGLPEEITKFDEDELFDFGYSVDGQFLAVTRGAWQHDVVLISDLHRLEKINSAKTP